MNQSGEINLSLSGVCKAAGGKYNEVTMQGTGEIQGDVDCSRFAMEGVITVSGGLNAAMDTSVKGKMKVRGDLNAEQVLLEGALAVAGNVVADLFQANGAFQIDGLLNSEEVKVRLFGASRVREMGGSSIQVMRESGNRWLNSFKKLSADLIEGDEIYLENTKAQEVRGNRVVLGPGCDIGRVEYQSDFQRDKDARVGSAAKR